LIRYVKTLDISGVEIVFPTEQELNAFHISGIDAQWLSGLPYTTIHAPFNLFSSHASEETILKQLNVISKLYERIHAKSVVFHPAPCEKLAPLTDRNFHVILENLPPGRHAGIPDLRRIFNEYPEFAFCLDISHAYLWSKYETARLLREFGSRLSQIHLSGTYRRKSHQTLQSVSRNFLQTIDDIKQLEVPLVIEEDFKVKSIAGVKKELNFIRGLFHDASSVTI
jgi:hypothetical protein